MKKNLICFDIPALIIQDVIDIMLDFDYKMTAFYDQELTFEKVIGRQLYVVSFEPNKHMNTRYAERIFDRILALKH